MRIDRGMRTRDRCAAVAVALGLAVAVGLSAAPPAGAAESGAPLTGTFLLAGGATSIVASVVPWEASVVGDPRPSRASFQVGPLGSALPDPQPWGLGTTRTGTVDLQGPAAVVVLFRYIAADGRNLDLITTVEVVEGSAPPPTDPGWPTPVSPPVVPPPSESLPGAAADPATLRQSYRLEVALDFDAGRLDTVETVAITNAGAAPVTAVDLSVIPEAMGYYTPVGEVTIDGAPARSDWTTGTNLRVTFLTALAPGATAELRIAFVLRVTERMGVGRSTLMRSLGVLALGEWFPILSREHDTYGIGDGQVSWNADEIVLDLTSDRALPRDAVACAGDIVTAPRSSGTHWVCRSRDARDYAFAVSPEFHRSTTSVGPVTIRTYAVSGRGSAASVLAVRAIRAYTAAYGAYPYSSLTIAEAGPRLWANEFPSLVFVGTSVIADPYVVYHEVAHQWFYAALGNDQQVDPIVDEGLAEFSADRALGRHSAYCSSLDVDEPVDSWPAGALSGEWMGCGGYYETVYHKGAAFYEAVRKNMGSTAFYATLRDLLVDRRFDVLTHDELFAAFEARTPSVLSVLRRFTDS